MGGGRDDFSKRTRTALAARAGMLCSNPSCRRGTCKADPENENNWIDLGIAAHITAASPNGPRYDESLTGDQRRSSCNGLWLCHHCAKEVDSASSTYTIETLAQWKNQAEACTARDAATSQDEIARLIGDIEIARGEIFQYIDQVQRTDPTFSDPQDDWGKRVERIIAHARSSQAGWDEGISQRIADCLVRASGVLGEQHDAVAKADRVAQFARTNPLGMREMAESLDGVRSHLLLR